MAGPERKPVRSRLAWFVMLYIVSLAAFAAVVYGLRALVPR